MYNAGVMSIANSTFGNIFILNRSVHYCQSENIVHIILFYLLMFLCVKLKVYSYISIYVYPYFFYSFKKYPEKKKV